MTAPPLVRELKGLLPAPLVAEALETFMDMLRAAGAMADPKADVDALVDALRAADRPALGQVYDAMRETDIFRRIVTAEPLRAAAQAMTGAVRLHSPFQHAVFRMDLAGEPWRGFDWHQDYPYNMLCDRSVTAWTPLTPSGAINGGVDVVETATPHLYPVDVRLKRDAEGRPLGGRDGPTCTGPRDDRTGVDERCINLCRWRSPPHTYVRQKNPFTFRLPKEN